MTKFKKITKSSGGAAADHSVRSPAAADGAIRRPVDDGAIRRPVDDAKSDVGAFLLLALPFSGTWLGLVYIQLACP